MELFKDFLKTTEEEWDRVLAVNLKSVFLCSRGVVPHMIARGGGAIVNTPDGTYVRLASAPHATASSAQVR
jgi:NAD(P)-dependent dehydrogenase (short-subunit alcohol dehydrogenase family)